MSSNTRIVVLDGFTMNPGDLSWEPLKSLGEYEIFDRTAPDDIVERSKTAHAVLTNKVELTRSDLEELPDLKYIGVTATGVNIVDIPTANARGITVTNVPSYSTPSVAQMVFAHVLNYSLRVHEHSEAVKAGRWAASEDFCFWDYPLVELAGSTMGIIGFGRIGSEVGKLATAFGMNVLAHNRSAVDPPEGVRMVGMEELLRESDYVTLHCPLTAETENLINRERLAMMKPSAMLINTGRGPLVDEAALAEALHAERIAWAGIDVLSSEPPQKDHPLMGVSNCTITPHIAWATRSSRQRLFDQVVENLAQFLQDTPINVVNEPQQS